MPTTSSKLFLMATTLIIAHKLSTIEKADKIVVIHKGRIVEEGSHASLLTLNGFYYRLLHTQSLGTPKEATQALLTPKETFHELTEKLFA